MTTRPAPSGEERDAGITLVELLVAMLVSGIVATMVATVTIQAFRIQRQTLTRETDSTAASLAMETITRDLRQALATQVTVAGQVTAVNAFSTTTASSATLVTWSKADPVRVTYTLTNGTLTRAEKAPDSTGRGTATTFDGAGATRTSTVARNVTSTALFTYVRSDGTESTSYATDLDRALIAAVRVNLTVNSDSSGKLPGTTIQNTVVCQNL